MTKTNSPKAQETLETRLDSLAERMMVPQEADMPAFLSLVWANADRDMAAHQLPEHGPIFGGNQGRVSAYLSSLMDHIVIAFIGWEETENRLHGTKKSRSVLIGFVPYGNNGEAAVDDLRKLDLARAAEARNARANQISALPAAQMDDLRTRYFGL